MADFAKKWQALLSVLVMLVAVTIAWGKMDARVFLVENRFIEEKAAQSEVVFELRLIREEIVRLRVAQATTNQRLSSHLEMNK